MREDVVERRGQLAASGKVPDPEPLSFDEDGESVVYVATRTVGSVSPIVRQGERFVFRMVPGAWPARVAVGAVESPFRTRAVFRSVELAESWAVRHQLVVDRRGDVAFRGRRVTDGR